MTVDQRSLIAAAVIVPKLTYIAQHAWPTVATINRFTMKIKNYVWHATFAEEVDDVRAWLDANLASLDRTSGGLAVRDLRAEVMAMAATTVAQWATTGTTALHIAGDVLFAKAGELGVILMAGILPAPKIPAIRITPNSLLPPARGCCVQHSMWVTGRTLVTRAGGVVLHQHRAHVVAALRTLGIDLGQLKSTWEGDAYRVDGLGLLGSVYEQADHALTAMVGVQCLEWLPKAGLGELHLFHEGGRLLPARTEVPAAPTGGLIEGVVTWTLERRGILWFHPSRPKWRGDGDSDHRLGGFISVLLTNFPALLARRFDSEEVRMAASPADHPITALVTTCRTLTITTSTTCSDTVSDMSGQCGLQSALVQREGLEVQILHVHPHPSLSRQVSLWLAGKRRPHRRKHYKHYVRHAGIRRGLREATARADKWKTSSAAAASGLATLEWKRIRRVLGLGLGRSGALPAQSAGLCDTAEDNLHCAMEKTGAGGRDRGGGLLQPRAPSCPADILGTGGHCKHAGRAYDALLDANITALVEGCWRLGAALYFHAVWRWRVQHFDETNDVSAARHKLLLATRLRQGYSSMPFYVDPTGSRRLLSTAAGIVKQGLRQPWHGSHQEATSTMEDCCYLLFFDGGLRGNPGPGGSGAIVVRWPTTGGAYQLVWAGSMSYAARTTTNNVAEYMGLIVGLTACCQYGFSPLHVIGDSAMIIRQQATRTPPKAKHLTPLYWRCRRQLAGFRVLHWQHHLRAHNKMADFLANQAMDTQKSMQSRLDQHTMQSERWSALADIAGGDIGHWTLNNTEVDSERATVTVP